LAFVISQVTNGCIDRRTSSDVDLDHTEDVQTGNADVRQPQEQQERAADALGPQWTSKLSAYNKHKHTVRQSCATSMQSGCSLLFSGLVLAVAQPTGKLAAQSKRQEAQKSYGAEHPHTEPKVICWDDEETVGSFVMAENRVDFELELLVVNIAVAAGPQLERCNRGHIKSQVTRVCTGDAGTHCSPPSLLALK